MDHAPALSQLVEQARDGFVEQFGRPPEWTVAAPGRVNLIGEHTDYNDGFVTPMAIERYVVLAAGRPANAASGGASDAVTAYSQLIGERATFRVGPAAAAAAADDADQQLPGWCVYPHGVLDLLRKRDVIATPLEIFALSTVPLGGGLSSSAALEVATATLAEAVTGQPMDGRDKAKLCQQAENEYAGVPCGIMDQFASALCQEGEALRLDCRSLETTPVPLDDPSVTVLIINSNVKHSLGDSEYPARRAACESAARKLGVPALRDVTIDQLLAAESELDPVEFRRARHAVSEDERSLAFVQAASARDWPAAGEPMYGSHASLRDDFEVSCPQVDTLVELAQAIGTDGGVYGSRMTGGGFGGCTVTLADASRVEGIAEKILTGYREATGLEGSAFTTRPARGAHVVEG